MRRLWIVVCVVLLANYGNGLNAADLQDRRQRAAAAFHDGILLIHARSGIALEGDGFRQSPGFYYLTGLENTSSAVLAIEGASGKSWLFLNPDQPFARSLPPEAEAGPAGAARLGIDQVVDWKELEGFLDARAKPGAKLYYADDAWALPELPPAFGLEKAEDAPAWLVAIAKRWPVFEVKEAGRTVSALMAVQSPAELVTLRGAAKATVPAVLAGMRAIKPGVQQRAVEATVVNACWQQGAHGVSFWPWAMSGANGVFPRPFASVARYDHLNQTMQAGDLVRLDVGCEWDHYQGDLGRTVPVSGRYSDDQRETWNIFVAAYQAGVRVLRDGVTPDQVYDAWRTELLAHRASARSAIAKEAIDAWTKKENVPFWQVHTMNLDAGRVPGALRTGMTIDFEPIVAAGGQGYYLEDMFLITAQGAEKLTPGVPYTAEEIEAAMR
jgi:Xaa-Pro aminopeptidase